MTPQSPPDLTRPSRQVRSHIARWAKIKALVLHDLVEAGIHDKEGELLAAVLADLWDEGASAQSAVKKVASPQGDSLRGVSDALIFLEYFDQNVLWYQRGLRRLWRRLERSTWESRADEVDLAQSCIDNWWQPRSSANRAGEQIVALQSASRELSVLLGHVELLLHTHARERPARKRRRLAAKLDEVAAGARALRRLLQT